MLMKLQPNYSTAGDVLKGDEQVSLLRSWLQWGYFWGALLFPACVVVQVFLAGLAIMVSGSFIAAHKTFGYVIIWFPLILLLLALVGRLPRSISGLTALLAVLAFLQPVLIKVPNTLGFPVLSALHPVNALVVFTLPLFLSYRVWQLQRASVAVPHGDGGE
jgi:mercuric ion transport protein